MPITPTPKLYALISKLCALSPMPYALSPMPYTLCPLPYALSPLPFALSPMPYTLCLHSKLSALFVFFTSCGDSNQTNSYKFAALMETSLLTA